MPIAMYKIPFEVTTPIAVNLLRLLQSNAEWVSYNGTEASATFNSDNTLTITADGSDSWGLNIAQTDLTLSAGKTYKFSCDNIGSSTWISLDEKSGLILSSGTTSVEYTPSTDTTINKVMIWVNSGVVYDNVIWNIKLEEIS